MQTRRDLINGFIKARNFQRYLEIGVDNHWNFDYIDVELKESVDIEPTTNPTYAMPSDQFWATSEDKYDIIFIDGNHQGDQAYRDIYGALAHLARPDSLIVLHDCSPDTAIVGSHDYLVQGPWMGDVWTGFSYYRLNSEHYCYTIDMDCGCGIIDLSRSRQNVHFPEHVEKLYNVLRPEDVCYLSYQVLDDHREDLLGLISFEEFQNRKLWEANLN